MSPSSRRGSTAIIMSAYRPATRQLDGPDTALPMGGGDVPQLRRLDVEVTAAVRDCLALPQRADDVDRFPEHVVTQGRERPLATDDVLVEVLARTQPQRETPVREQLHRRGFLRDNR